MFYHLFVVRETISLDHIIRIKNALSFAKMCGITVCIRNDMTLWSCNHNSSSIPSAIASTIDFLSSLFLQHVPFVCKRMLIDNAEMSDHIDYDFDESFAEGTIMLTVTVHKKSD